MRGFRKSTIYATLVGLVVAGVLFGAGGALALIGAGAALSVPIIAAMMTASVVLIGVVITNAAHSDRQAQQLEHDRGQQGVQLAHDQQSTRLQREVEYKKELYVEAYAACNQVLSNYIDFRDPRLATSDVSKRLRESAEPISKLMVVADEQTYEHAQAFLNAMQAAIVGVYDSHGKLTTSWSEVKSLKEKAQRGEVVGDTALSDFETTTGDLDRLLEDHRAPFDAGMDPFLAASATLRNSLRREVTGLLYERADARECPTNGLNQ